MPHGNKPRGSRGKTTTKRHWARESARPAEEQASRLNKAIQRSKELFLNCAPAEQQEQSQIEGTVLNQLAASEQAVNTGASSSEPPPCIPCGVQHTGTIPVSIDSDSDQALSSPEEGPSSAEDTNTQAGATAGIQLTTGERSAPNGRLIITTRLSKNLI